jgi:glutamate dehydrogenase
LPDDSYFATTLAQYFPARMQKSNAGDIASHRLRREIIATVLANEAINRGGPAFVVNMMDATAASAPDVVRAAIVARDGFDLAQLWAEADALDNKISGRMQNRIYEEIGFVFTVLTRLLLKTTMVKGEVSDVIARIQAAFKQLKPLLAGQPSPEIAARCSEYQQAGVPEKLAREIAGLSSFALVPEIMQIADRTGAPLTRAAESYFAVSQTFRVESLLAAGGRIVTPDHYENLALARSIDQIASSRRDIAIAALANHGKEKRPVQAWHAEDRVRINRIAEELSGLSDSGEPNLARITVAAGLLTDLARDVGRR